MNVLHWLDNYLGRHKKCVRSPVNARQVYITLKEELYLMAVS